MRNTKTNPVFLRHKAPFAGWAHQLVQRYRFGADSITQAQRRQFDEDGYIVIDPQVPEYVLERIKAELYPHHGRVAPGTPGYPLSHRLMNAWNLSDAVRQLCVWPRVLKMLESLYGRKPLCFQSLNFPVGTQQRTHSDTVHFNSKPAGWMCGVWHALEDIDDQCGPVVYYPGSHKLPEYTLEDIPVPVIPESYDNYKHYETFIAGIVEKHNLKPKYATLKKGQAFIWASNLLHGGSPRSDMNRSRHSQVNHYFFEGCQYYTPLWSTREKVFWREPEWVPHAPVKKAA